MTTSTELNALADQVEALECEREFLLDRADAAGSVSFSTDRWTGISSNAIVALAFGRGASEMSLPSDGNDLLACYLTTLRLPRHLLTIAVLDQLHRGEDYVTSKYPDSAAWAQKKSGTSAAALRAIASQKEADE